MNGQRPACPEDYFLEITINYCVHCQLVCDPSYQSAAECQQSCPDYKPHLAILKQEDQTATSFELEPTFDTTTDGTHHIVIFVIPFILLLICLAVVTIFLIHSRKVSKPCVTRRKFSKTRTNQAYDTRSVNNENAYNKNHTINESYNVINDESLNIHLEELSIPQQCSDDYSHPQYIPRDNYNGVAGIHDTQHSDSMLSTNLGSMKPHFEIKGNARPLDQYEYAPDLISSSRIVQTESSTSPKIKGQSGDEACSAPAKNIHPRMPAHEKYPQHQNDPNRHNLQSNAENSPLMKDMATGTEVSNSIIDIQPPFLRNISSERQHSQSSPEPNEVTETRLFLVPSQERQHMMLIRDVEPQCLMMPSIIPYDNQQEPYPNQGMSNQYRLPVSTRSSTDIALNPNSSPPSRMLSNWNNEPPFPQHHHDRPNSNTCTEQFLEASRGRPNDNSSRRSFPSDMESNGKTLQHNQDTKPKIRMHDQYDTENSHDTSFRLPVLSTISSELSLSLHSSPPSQMPSTWSNEPHFPQHHHDIPNSNIEPFLEAVKGFSGVIYAEFIAGNLSVTTEHSSSVGQLDHLKKAIQDIMPQDLASYQERIIFKNGSFMGLKYAAK